MRCWQFFFDDEPPNRDQFRAQARHYGFDEADYLAALDRAPRWSREKVNRAMTFYTLFAHLFSAVSYSNLQLARSGAERETLLNALQDSEARFRRAVEDAPVPIMLHDEDGGILQLSQGWTHYSGYTLADLPTLGDWIERAYGGAQTDSAKEYIDRLFLIDATVNNGEWLVTAKDGSQRIWEFQTTPLGRIHQEKRVLMSLAVDITERKQTEEALHRSLADAQRHHTQMVTLNRMNERLLSCETPVEAYEVIASSAGALCAGCSGGLAIREATAPNLRVVATWGHEPRLPETFLSDACWALQRGEPYAVADPVHSLHCQHFVTPPKSASLCVPLTVRGETFGLLQVSAATDLTGEAFEEWRTLVLKVSGSIKLALSNLKLQEALREQAIHDALTGLFNRRYLDEILPRELRRCQRTGESLAVAMLDLDHFKGFNDTFGHEAGDAILRAVGELLWRSSRAGDHVFRYGCEELTLILLGITADPAKIRLDGLRQAITQLRLLHHGHELPAITVSIGVAVAEKWEMDAPALLARADAALYQAKTQGRNRVVMADEEGPA